MLTCQASFCPFVVRPGGGTLYIKLNYKISVEFFSYHGSRLGDGLRERTGRTCLDCVISCGI